MSGPVKRSSMPGSKVVTTLEYWWKNKASFGSQPNSKLKPQPGALGPNAAATTNSNPKPKSKSGALESQVAAPITPSSKPEVITPPQREPRNSSSSKFQRKPTPDSSSPPPNEPKPEGPKKRRLTPGSLMSAIHRGSITVALSDSIRRADEGTRRALQGYDPTPGVCSALESIEAKVRESWEKQQRAVEWLTFGQLAEKTGPISALGTAFLDAGLAAQSVAVFTCLIKVADTWIWSKRYQACDGHAEFCTWDECLVSAVARLDRRTHAQVLESCGRDLSAVVNGQSCAYGVDLEQPLAESREAVDQILRDEKYTCANCREVDLARGFPRCSTACNQQRNYAAFVELTCGSAESDARDDLGGSDMADSDRVISGKIRTNGAESRRKSKRLRA